MERHVEALLNKISYAAITVATIALLLLFLRTPETCVTNTSPSRHPTKSKNPHPKSLHLPPRFPKSTCDATHRELVSIEKKNKRLWSTKAWIQTLASYTEFFRSLQHTQLLSKHSKTLCVSAGAGHAVMALTDLGISDVTGVEVLDSPPLVNRADPHSLPFFDGAFDLAFTAHFAEALFPARFASEMERTVRDGGICVLAMEDCTDEDLKEIVGLFRRSKLVSADYVTLVGVRMRRIIMRIRFPP